MALETFLFLCGSYRDLAAADADYHALRTPPDASALVDSLEVVAIGARADGQVRIYRHRSESAESFDHRPERDLAIGLAVALFPAAGLEASEWSSIAAARASTVAGHLVRDMDRSDIEELGRRLDSVPAALILALAPDDEERVTRILNHPLELIRREVTVEMTSLEAQIRHAEGGSTPRS